MKVYRNSIIVTGIISLITICLTFILHGIEELSVYYNIVIGIFGGAVVTFITSIIGYKVAKLETLETFYLYARRYVKEFNRLDKGASIKHKIDYFINYMNKDLPDLGIAYRDICFLFDFCNKNKLYIYNNIYLPIITLDKKINYHYWHFVSHKDGSEENIEVMSKFVEEIEDLIIEKKVREIKIVNSEGEEQNTTCTQTNNKFTESIRKELSGRYYKIMYGKKIYNEMLEKEKDQDY